MAATYDPELEALLKALPTPKMERFCREYFVSLSPIDSARNAHYKGNDRTLSAIGVENLSKPSIIAVMDLFFERKANEVEINAGVIEREYWKLYNLCMNEGDKSVARQCLKDLGEHHAMFIKVVASAEASELALRLASGRSRMNDARSQREAGAEPGPVAVGAGPAAL